MTSTTATQINDEQSLTLYRSSISVPKASSLAAHATRNFLETHKPELPDSPQESTNETLQVLKDWEGVVDEVNADGFVARLMDRQNRAGIDTHVAEIPFSEVIHDDLALVQPGAIFYLTIYRSIAAHGQHERTTRLYFRRLPAWTPTLLKSARERADRWKTLFHVGKNLSTG
jgi:hypothetical protein